MRTRTIFSWKRSAVAVIIAIALTFAGLSPVFAAPGPSHGEKPLYQPCQLWSWVEINSNPDSTGAFTITDSLQEEYDSNFGVWCNYYRTNTALKATSANTTGGTITARVAACGGSWSGTSYTFPSGAFGPYHYASPPVHSAGAAESGHIIQAGSLYESNSSQCYSG